LLRAHPTAIFAVGELQQVPLALPHHQEPERTWYDNE
jgi:hypothetical protein